MNNKITGQLIFRDAGSGIAGEGRKLMMVVGILAVPETIELKGEHQYTLFGGALANAVSLTILQETATDRTEQGHGSSLGQLVLQPIWRV